MMMMMMIIILRMILILLIITILIMLMLMVIIILLITIILIILILMLLLLLLLLLIIIILMTMMTNIMIIITMILLLLLLIIMIMKIIILMIITITIITTIPTMILITIIIQTNNITHTNNKASPMPCRSWTCTAPRALRSARRLGGSLASGDRPPDSRSSSPSSWAPRCSPARWPAACWRGPRAARGAARRRPRGTLSEEHLWHRHGGAEQGLPTYMFTSGSATTTETEALPLGRAGVRARAPISARRGRPAGRGGRLAPRPGAKGWRGGRGVSATRKALWNKSVLIWFNCLTKKK